MQERFMIYGASGQTGRLLAQTARRKGQRPVLAGRSASSLKAVAEPLGLSYCAIHLGETGRLVESLRGKEVVLNAAGPFASTWRPLVEACLRTGTHYLDISGELPVFESLHRWSSEAARRDVMLMPGVGFLVVASDCLAAHVVRRLPSASSLYLGISRSCFVSQGTARSLLTLASDMTVVRRGGELVAVPLGARHHTFDFGDGARTGVALPFGDVFTAYLTTGVPNIEICLEANPAERLAWLGGRFFSGLLHTALCRALGEMWVGMLPEIPPDEQRAEYGQILVAEAVDAAGRRVVARLQTSESYSFTCMAALAVVQRILSGDFETGFRTPAQVYGPELALQLEGVFLEDLV